MTPNLKDDLRHRIAGRLAALNDVQRGAAAARVCGLLKTLLPGPDGQVLLGYLPLPGELDVEAALRWWLDGRGTLTAPIVDWAEGTMQAGALTGLDDGCLRTGKHGVREPASGEVIPLPALTAVLVPGLAFDAAGHRLGRGGGFYDRLLGVLPKAARRIGVCFDEQLVDIVPVDAHDQGVDVIVTPAGVVEAR